ncbi:MAG: carbohydrate-binding protein [Paludibacteraceae bacterium]|nr:carbohydrate-binding protein [Paludibacteraceae bacterium]
MKTRLFTALALAMSLSSFAADFNLKVNLGDSIRPVTHVASGSLYGLTESLPADIATHVAPLKPNAFLNPAVSGSGRQQPIGDAFKAAERVKNTTAKVHIRLADILPGWPYKWNGWNNWESEVTKIVNKRKSSNLNFDGYEIWNEPYGTWNSANGDYHSFLWKKTYDLLRRLDPGCRIIGPSFAFYSSSRMESFVKYCSENNCMPDVISWHQWGSGGFVDALNHYRSMEKKYNVSPRKISINEYCAGSDAANQKYEGCPGYSVPFIAKFERHGVESAMISWWFTNLPGRLGSLLTSQNQKGGGWHLYKWYGDMEGYMAAVTPPNDKSDGLDGFAAVNKKMREASVVLGGSSVGSVDVTIDGVPSWMGNEVEVKVEVVTWENKDKAVDGPQTLANSTYTVNNGRIVVPVNVTSKLYGYRIYITPGATIPKTPFLGKAISIPGVVEAEHFDNGSDGISYHDKDRQNRGEGYRLETGVDVYALKDKSDEYAVGYAQKEEWLEYTVNIENEAYYNIQAILSSGGENSGIQLLLDGKEITDMMQTPPNDNDWESYLETETRTLSKLPQGQHILRMNIVGDWINIDKFIFTEYDPTNVDMVDAEEIQSYEIYDIFGRKCDEIEGESYRLPYILKEKGYSKGVYLGKTEKKVVKIILE